MKILKIIPLTAVATLLMSFTGAYGMDITGNFIMETRFSTSNGDLLFNQESGSLKFEQASRQPLRHGSAWIQIL